MSNPHDSDGALETLRRLKTQVDGAISLIEGGLMRDMAEADKEVHRMLYGEGVFLVGDFAIQKRSIPSHEPACFEKVRQYVKESFTPTPGP